MADTAAHLVDRVFPEVPVRQWVLSLPYWLRYRLAYDARLVRDVLQVFVRAVFASGILAPCAALRRMVVPQCALDGQRDQNRHPGCSNKGGNFPDGSGNSERKGQSRPRNYSWAELMKRVWSLDVLQCDRCGGRMRIVCANHPSAAVKSILECLGLPSRPPPIAPATPITEECATDLEEKGARLC